MSLIFQTFTTYCFIIALEEFTTQIIYIQLLEYIILYHRLLPKASCEKCFFLPTMNFRNGFPVLLTSYEITYRKLVCRRLFLVYISRLQSRLLGAYSCEGILQYRLPISPTVSRVSRKYRDTLIHHAGHF